MNLPCERSSAGSVDDPLGQIRAYGKLRKTDLHSNERNERGDAFNERHILLHDGRGEYGSDRYDKDEVKDVQLGQRSFPGNTKQGDQGEKANDAECHRTTDVVPVLEEERRMLNQ